MKTSFINQKIKCIRPMTEEEYQFEGWDNTQPTKDKRTLTN